LRGVVVVTCSCSCSLVIIISKVQKFHYLLPRSH
jgi:hypothetical protein